MDIVSNTDILAREGEKRGRIYEHLFSIRRKGLPHARAVARGSNLMSMVFTATLERVDMRLLRIIVVVRRFCPSIHRVAYERKPPKIEVREAREIGQKQCQSIHGAY